RKERIGRMVRMFADRREDVEELHAGDIAAILGPKTTTTGDTIARSDDPILLERITFPDPVIQIAVEPNTKSDQDKMSEALHKLAEEDPTFHVSFDEQTSQTIIAGMGELHLEVIVDRMRREFGVECRVGRPRVSYRETIRKPAETNTTFKKQTGGSGQFARVALELEPNEPGGGYVFEDLIRGGAIPREYIRPTEQGITQALEAGVLAGYPVVDIKVKLVDGSHHEVDSSEMAFKICGEMAFKEAMRKGDPVLLEPLMKVEVVTPEEYLGSVQGNLAGRRGQIQSMEQRPGGAQSIIAFVPLSEMFGYATDLRSMSQGRANFTMEFDHYDALPASLAEKVMKGETV
ncbi:MAG: elongation factor G, partial [Chloroflexi bacterium]|nr:elongation factor G [Chloroflexota bacterium]